MRFRAAWLVIVLGLLAASAEANAIFYNLSFTPDPGYPSSALTGTLVTNAKIGQISASDVLGWSFTQTGTFPFFISGGLGSFNCTGCFTATATTLSFDFSSAGSSAAFNGVDPQSAELARIVFADSGVLVDSGPFHILRALYDTNTLSGVIGAGSPAIAYDLSFTPDPGYPSSALTGTLITDAKIGQIFASDVLSWSFTETGTFPFNISGPPDSFACIGAAGCFTATATTLSFDFSSAGPGGPSAAFNGVDPQSAELARIVFADSGVLVDSGPFHILRALYDTNTPSGVIGTAPTTAVPEPATVALLGVGLAVGVVCRRRATTQRVSRWLAAVTHHEHRRT